MKQIICWLLGHNWRCLMRYQNLRDDWHGSEVTGWLCDRCDKQDTQQWDF